MKETCLLDHRIAMLLRCCRPALQPRANSPRATPAAYLLLLAVCSSVLTWKAAGAAVDSGQTVAAYVSTATILDRPLVFIGDTPPPQAETEVLWDSLESIRTNQWPASLSAAEGFLSSYPQSGWVPSLRSLLAQAYHEAGRDTLALQHWQIAWNTTQTSNSGPAKLVGDYTLAHWSRLLASLGRYEALVALRQQNGGRVLDRGPLSQMWGRTGEAIAHMKLQPGLSYRCGTFALCNVARALNLKFNSGAILAVPSPTNGFSMATLANLSTEHGLGLVPVVRQSSALIPVPSVIHWSQNHYAAIVAQRGDLYRVDDPTFGRSRWMVGDVINAEASGYFMVVSTNIPSGFTPLSTDQAAVVLGQGMPDFFEDADDQCCECDGTCPPGGNALAGEPGRGGGSGAGGSGLLGHGGGGCGGCSLFGMAGFRISEPYINIWSDDEPLAYQPPFGPRLSLLLSYKQREEDQPFVSDGGCFGSNWGCSWLGLIDSADYNRYGTFDFTIYYPRGGLYNFNNAEVIATNYFNSLKLVAATNNSGVLTNLLILRPDGGMDVYGFSPTNWDGTPYRYHYLSQKISPEGFATSFYYAAYNPTDIVIKLANVVDPNGGTNSIYYQTNGDYTNFINEVSDPFGRSAFFYYDTNGLLTSITDEIGLTSSFLYDQNGWLTNLTTPYGVTSFAPVDMPTGGEGCNPDRSVDITQPDLGHQLYAFVGAPPYEPSAFDDSLVPTNTPIGTLDNAPNDRNSYYWGPLQYSALSTNVVNYLTSSDFLRARMRHWLVTDRRIDTLSIQREPSPDGTIMGQLTWYDYADKGTTNGSGDHILPWVLAQVLPDGSTWYQFTERDGWFKPTNTISTYTTSSGVIALRTNVNVYATNGVDLAATIEADGSTNGYAYNSNHQVTGITNAVGDITAYSYNGNGQLARISSAAGLTTVNTYFGSGPTANWLQQTADIEIKRTNSFTYYNNGLVYSHTDERGLTTTNYWDNLQRVTGTVFPDNTTISNVYTYLDLTATKDRLGYWTHFTYDSMRRKVSETNPNNVVTAFAYCNCGALEYLTNAVGTPVQTIISYSYDNQGNRTYTFNPDGYNVTNWFDSLGRIYITGDGTGYRWSYFNNQGLLTAISNACGIERTTVFDIRDQPLYSTDARGVTVTNTHDRIGRLTSRGYPDGGIEQFGYSPRGMTLHSNQLGYITQYAFDPGGRKIYETNANSELLRFTNNAAGDLLSLTDGKSHTTKWNYDIYGRVTNKIDQLGSTILKYAYDPDGRLTNRQYFGTSSNTKYKYDPVGNLTNITYPSSGTVKLQYDALNRLTNLVDSVGTTKYTYTAAGQLVTEIGPISGMAVTNSYVNRLRVALQASGAWTNGFAYDLAGRLTNVTSKAGSFTNIYYSGPNGGFASRLIQQLRLANQSNITNNFDSVGRLLATHLRTSAGVLTNKHEYQYDLAGQRTNQTRIDGITVPYTYDAIGQLKTAYLSGGTASDQWRYGYDAAWNMTWRTNGSSSITAFQFNNANELTSPGTPSYDSEGNPINYNDIAGYFTWDDENRLIQISDTVYHTFQTTFAYDGFGRLRTRTEWTWQDNGDGTGQWNWASACNYLWDGWCVIEDSTANYTRGVDLSGTLEGAGGIGGLLARTDGNGSTYYHADGNGNITCLLDGTQTQVAYYRYNDPYGNNVSASGSLASANVYRFSSKEIHPSTGLYYYGYRFYDPSMQRWPNRDPLGERAGVNLYRPMANNTVGNVDVDGRSWTTTTGPKGGVDFGSVICMNGKPVPYIPRSKQLTPAELKYLDGLHPGYAKSYSCYMDCVNRHEQSHAADALAENPNICTGVPNGTFVMNNDPTALYKSELKAHEISKKCLQDCKKTCPGNHVDEGLKNEKDWEDKYVYE